MSERNPERTIPDRERNEIDSLPVENPRRHGYHPQLESLEPGKTVRKIVGRNPETGEPVEADVMIESIERDQVTGATIIVESFETPEALRPASMADGGGVGRGE